MKTKALNIDCMEYMAGLEDNAFELAVVDPEYGIDVGNMTLGMGKSSRTTNPKNRIWTKKDWDKSPPHPKYFAELFRVSKNQIIWGGNYFALPPSQYFCVWDKGEGLYGRSFAECEQAWVSSGGTRIYKGSPLQKSRIHPTQKPVALYRWLLTNYAKPGDRILDTHLGSGSSRIAAEELGFEFVGCELDQEYFEAQEKRFKQWYAQGNLFRDQPKNNSGDQLQLL